MSEVALSDGYIQSVNTFGKFRVMGLKICEIDGVKRVSREEINKFLESYSQ